MSEKRKNKEFAVLVENSKVIPSSQVFTTNRGGGGLSRNLHVVGNFPFLGEELKRIADEIVIFLKEDLVGVGLLVGEHRHGLSATQST